MNQQMIEKIQRLTRVTANLAKARSVLEEAKSDVAHLVDQEAKLRREISEDPDARELFGLRAPKARTKREG